jgi:hypothetical protein
VQSDEIERRSLSRRSGRSRVANCKVARDDRGTGSMRGGSRRAEENERDENGLLHQKRTAVIMPSPSEAQTLHW